MTTTRYTAILSSHNQELATSFGDDFMKLLVRLLSLLEHESSSAVGKIIETRTGKIVHQCRKSASE